MQIAQKNPKRVTYSVDEAAKILGISRNSAYAACAAGTIPSIRIGERRIGRRPRAHAERSPKGLTAS
jgi:excisionase family DNA binding protein